MSLLTYHSQHVTLDMCINNIYMAILRDFGVSNFFVSDSVTLARPRGAFAPKIKEIKKRKKKENNDKICKESRIIVLMSTTQ